MRKRIGNILLIIAGVSLVILLLKVAFHWDIESRIFMFPYVIGLLGGGALRIGDFFKWRAKKFQEGINEAKGNYNKFCPHCGNCVLPPLRTETLISYF